MRSGTIVTPLVIEPRSMVLCGASRSGLRIVDEYHRPVLHRTEKDRAPYSETIFHMRLNET